MDRYSVRASPSGEVAPRQAMVGHEQRIVDECCVLVAGTHPIRHAGQCVAQRVRRIGWQATDGEFNAVVQQHINSSGAHYRMLNALNRTLMAVPHIDRTLRRLEHGGAWPKRMQGCSRWGCTAVLSVNGR